MDGVRVCNVPHGVCGVGNCVTRRPDCLGSFFVYRLVIWGVWREGGNCDGS